jgi:tetratricopeptide (TPR) repeat protein
MHIPQTEVILRHDGAELARVTLPPGEYVIGRNPDAEIFADTPLLSRRHAQLTINYDHLLIEDLGSSNGTFVNEQPIAEATRLFPNQAVRLGDVTVELRRERARSEPGVSLAPAQAAIRRFLPDELLAEKRYAVGSQIARGGMGAILDARQNATQRTVAMKVMLGSGDEADVLRFIEEAQVTAQLDHPNIVPIYELGVDEQEQLFYTMKLVRGITLKKVLELLEQGVEATAKKYPLPALLTIFQKVCDAVAFAHAKGVIHRDLKPENIMLGDFGSVLVMDWGLAKVLAGKDTGPRVPGGAGRSFVMSARAAVPGSGSTLSGTIMGTPQYMAPEQARGEVEALDARADIYALGAILFEILHLRPTVSGDDAMEIVGKVERGGIEWDGGKKARVPDGLLAVCRKALALDPVQRYPSVEDLQRDLAAYQSGFATGAEKAKLGRLIALWMRRHKSAALAAVLVLVVGLSFGTRAILEGRRAEREAARAKAALADLRKTAPALLRLAASEAGLQRYDSALENLDAALAIDPGLAAADWHRGWVLLAQEKLPEALTALRVAAGKDPANHRFAALLPLVEKMAAAPAPQRHELEIVKPLYDHLTAVGAVGEATPLLPYLKLGNDARLVLVRERVERWLGKAPPGASSPAVYFTQGSLFVSIQELRTGTLEPLHGLPIDNLSADGCELTSLEPLRGMHLTRLTVGRNPIDGLGPLTGMPIEDLQLDNTTIKDLSPLHGMPLKKLVLFNMRGLTDLRPLAGLPLEDFSVTACAITDFLALRGMPLRKLSVGSTKFADGRVLVGMPLEDLDITSTLLADLNTLAGLPLRSLRMRNCPVADYTPLLRIPSLENLEADVPAERLLMLRAHPGLKQIKNRDSSYRPVAEYWAAYDAQQAAGKK